MNIPKHLSNTAKYITFLLFLFIGNADAQILIDSVIAVVNGQPITQSELTNEFRIDAILGKPLSREPTEAEKQAYLDRIISRRFVLQGAEKIGITAVDHKKQVAARTAAIRSKFPSDVVFRNVLREQELEIEVLEKWMSDEIIYSEYFTRQFVRTVDSKEIDELAPQYFEANKAQFVAPATVTFRSALVVVAPDSSKKEKQAAKRLAEHINSRLLQGETYETVKQSSKTEKSISFNSLTLTTDTSLGAIVAQLEPSERKGPIPVPEGFRIVELVKKTSERQKQFSEVKDQVADLIRHNKAETAFKEWLTRQKADEPWYILEDALKRVSGIKIQPTK
ncbi:peptidyl-prolyl cis-trans isomerase [Candidatus Poribacteria bacterium]|nr:peptidyl-prolyl cis-trans isomerase [Candidatus Poribacteria bacterium]